MFKKIITILLLALLIVSPFKSRMSRVNRVTPPAVEKLPEHFDKVYKTFNSYNNNTDTTLVITFCEVATLYGLDTNERVFNLLLGQALQESGAQQYRGDSTLVVSPTGAVGFAQILRSTSILYLKKCITKEDSVIFNKVGVTEFSFVNDRKLNRRKKWAKARLWLSNYVNNIAMWGKIMSEELKRKDINKALICYNVGPRGLRKFLKRGNDSSEHHYVVGIKNKLRFIK